MSTSNGGYDQLSYLTPVFHYLSKIMGLLKFGLTAYDIFSRVDSIGNSYLKSNREGNRAVFEESFGFGGCLIVGIPLSTYGGPIGFVASVFVNIGADWGGKKVGGYAFDYISKSYPSFNELTILDIIKRNSKINFFATNESEFSQ